MSYDSRTITHGLSEWNVYFFLGKDLHGACSPINPIIYRCSNISTWTEVPIYLLSIVFNHVDPGPVAAVLYESDAIVHFDFWPLA